MKRNLFFASAAALALSFFCVHPGFAEPVTLSASKVSMDTLRPLIDKDVVQHEVDGDGDLKIEKDDIVAYVEVDAERNLIHFFAIAQGSKSVSDSRAMKLVNNWNSKKIFTAVHYEVPSDRKSEGGSFWIEYYMKYTGGLNSVNLNDSLSLFFDIADEFFDYLDTEDAM